MAVLELFPAAASTGLIPGILASGELAGMLGSGRGIDRESEVPHKTHRRSCQKIKCLLEVTSLFLLFFTPVSRVEVNQILGSIAHVRAGFHCKPNDIEGFGIDKFCDANE